MITFKIAAISNYRDTEHTFSFTNTMPTTFIHHIGITAPAEIIADVTTFYDQILGLKPGLRPTFSFGGIWLYSGDQSIIHLLENATRSGETSGHFDHVALRCEDLDSVISKLEHFNIAYHRSEVTEVNQTQLFVVDPSGTKIELNFQS